MYSSKPNPKVLFVRPEYNTRFTQQTWLVTEPLDLEYLAAIASEQGCKWRIHDPVVSGESFSGIVEEFRPDVIAITGYFPAKDRMIAYAEKAKAARESILTVIGGVHAEVNHTDFHHDAVDIVVHSGGAVTFRTMLKKINEGTSPADIAGICHRTESGEWCCREKAPFNPAALPMPDRSHFNKYRDQFSYLHYGPVALIKTAYGCPFDCKFCYCKMLNGGQYVARRIEDVVDEIKGIDCNRIWIVDDTFLIDPARVRHFATLLKQENIRKEFIIYSRSEFIAKNPELVPLLKDAGIIDIIIGFESIREDLLNNYNKRIAEKESRRCIQLLNDAGIECTGLFIMDINATAADFHALSRWINKAGLKTYTLSIFTPYPGTEPYEQYKDRIKETDCRMWDLRHLIMKPTRMSRSRFYLLVFGMHIKMLAKNKNLRRHVIARIFRTGRKKKNIWDFWAGRYEALWVQRFSLEPTRRKILENIPVRPGQSILDMGCGTGQLLSDLKGHFGAIPFDYTGVDQSPDMIKAAHIKHPCANFAVSSSAEYYAPDKTYDVIVCTHAFPYFPDKQKTLEKFARMLKDGGILLLAQASMNNPYDVILLAIVKLTTTQSRYLSRRRMRRLAKPAFQSMPEETRISPNILIPSIYLFKWTKSMESGS